MYYVFIVDPYSSCRGTRIVGAEAHRSGAAPERRRRTGAAVGAGGGASRSGTAGIDRAAGTARAAGSGSGAGVSAFLPPQGVATERSHASPDCPVRG
eukprot:COSAG02_NODE_821_length_16794_cov_42.795747_15_plen_97_part_00